jgi:hypothetical protein
MNWRMGAGVEILIYGGGEEGWRKTVRSGKVPISQRTTRRRGVVPGGHFESAIPTDSFAKFPISSTEVRDVRRKSKVIGSGDIAD